MYVRTTKSTPPLAKRRYSERDEEVIDCWLEANMLNGTFKQIQSPLSAPLHVVHRKGKPRIVCDNRRNNIDNVSDASCPVILSL